MATDYTFTIEEDPADPRTRRFRCSCGENGSWARGGQADLRGTSHVAGHRVRDAKMRPPALGL